MLDKIDIKTREKLTRIEDLAIKHRKALHRPCARNRQKMSAGE